MLPPRRARGAPLDEIHSKGYAFQIECTYRTLRKGFRVREIPIRFVDRVEGGSKMSQAIVVEAVWKVPLLRLEAQAGSLTAKVLRTSAVGLIPMAAAVTVSKGEASARTSRA